MPLKIYSETLENLARSKSSEIFSNKDDKHASIAIQKLLKYTKEKFILYDDDLKGDIFTDENSGNISTTLINFIAKGGEFTIILKEKIDKISKFGNTLRLLNKFFSSQVKVLIASDNFKNDLKEKFEGCELNFAVGDKDMFRLEKHEGNLLREAKVSFNNKYYPNKILGVFNKDYNFQSYFV